MFNQNILYGLIALILVLIGLLFRAYFLGGSRMQRITKATDSVRSGAERTQKELAVTRAEVTDLRASVIQMEDQLRQRTKALLEQNLIVTQCKTELEQLRIEMLDLRDRLEKIQNMSAQKSPGADSGRPWRLSSEERSAGGSPNPTAKSETVHRAESEAAERESSSGWRADLNEILKSLDSTSTKREK